MRPDALRKSFEVLHQRVSAIIYYINDNCKQDAQLMAIVRNIIDPLDDLHSHYWQLDLEEMPKNKEKTPH